MSNTLQSFLAQATTKAAVDLQTALERLPVDKRNWNPADNSRSALNQVAECAIMNGFIAAMMPTKTWSQDFDFQRYQKDRDELAEDEHRAISLLQENTAKAVEQTRNVPDDDLNIEIAVPWGTQTLAEIMAYPYWNMKYHEGQINYIASLLGPLN